MSVDESLKMNIKINNLDYDCLLMIFSYFPLEERFKIKNVCQKWRDVSHLIWTNVQSINCPNVYSNNIILTQSDLENIIRKCEKYLKQLTLNDHLKTDSILEVCKSCINIQYLDFSNSNDITDETIETIIQNFNKLTYLDISNNWHLTKKSLNQLGKLKNLKNIILNDIIMIDDETINQFKNMKIVEFEIACVTDNSIKNLIENSHDLEVLNIAGNPVTIDVLIFASKITKKRQKKLKIIVSKYFYEEFKNENSSFLTIVT